MKLLFFTQIYPSAREPTRGPYNRQSFGALAAYCEARVVSPRPWWTRVRRPKELLRTPVERVDGIPVAYPTYWTVPRFAPELNDRALYVSLRAQIAQLHREFPFDAIMAAWAFPDAAAAALIAREYGCPLVTRVMGSDVNHLGQDPKLGRYVRTALQRSQRIIAVSDALRERMIDMGIPPGRIAVLRNAVDGERFVLRDRREARATLSLPQERPIILYVGRLSHEKGGDVLIEAMGHLKRAGRGDVLLAMVGGGKMETPLHARAEALGVAEQVRFCGERPHSEVPLYLSGADLLCLPSRREGCPNVVLEALASGRPVVGTRVGGVPELLGRGNGLMVPSEDPEALAAALEEALKRTWHPRVLRDTVEFLSWEDVGRREWQIVQEAAGEWKGAGRALYQELVGAGPRACPGAATGGRPYSEELP